MAEVGKWKSPYSKPEGILLETIDYIYLIKVILDKIASVYCTKMPNYPTDGTFFV